MGFKAVSAVEDDPLLRMRGDFHKFAEGVEVAGDGCEFDEPGIVRLVVTGLVEGWVVVDFMGEEEKVWRAVNDSAGEMPAHHFLEGLGGVLLLPEFCAFPWSH